MTGDKLRETFCAHQIPQLLFIEIALYLELLTKTLLISM